MTVETVRDALLWCGIINYAMLVIWAWLVLLAPNFLRWFGSWFRLPAEQFNAIQYGGLLAYKLAILLFNLVPYVVLRIVG